MKQVHQLPVTGANILGRASVRGSGPEDPAQPGGPASWRFAAAAEEEIAQAVSLAVESTQAMDADSGEERAARLRAAAAGLEAHRGQIVETADLETSLGATRLQGEFDRTLHQLHTYADAVASFEVEVTPGDSETSRPEIVKTWVAVGPVAVFGAGNFPLAFGALGTDTAAALAAGCPVIVKAHPSHPATNELCVRAALEGLVVPGAPAPLSLLHGSASVGTRLAQAPGLAAIAFTGSQEGGRALMDTAARRLDPIPVYAEMGSVNPVVISPGAATRRGGEMAGLLASAITGSGGQLCTKPGVILVPQTEDGEAMLAALVGHLAEAGPFTLLDDRISSRLSDRLTEAMSQDTTLVLVDGREDGATLLEWTGRADSHPTLVQQELFGPAAVVVRYHDISEATAWVSTLGGQLTWTFHAEIEERQLFRPLVSRGMRMAGRLVWNGVPTGVAVVSAMHHGGPWPASSSLLGSVGPESIDRFRRPVTLQGFPSDMLTHTGDGQAGEVILQRDRPLAD